MKKHLIAAAIIASLAGSALAQTVATVNGTKIDSKDVDAQVSLLIKESQNQLQDSPQLRDSITKRLVTRTLMIQEAKRLKLDQSPQYQNALKQAEAEAKRLGDDKKPGFKQDWATFQDNLLTQAFLAAVLGSNPVTKAESDSSYAEMKKYYQGTQEVQLGEIVTRDADSANKAVADLKAKKNFSAVARQYTIDPAGKEAGGIPKTYVSLKDLQEGAAPVYEAVKDLKKGQFTTAPLQGNNNIFAVFYINDKRNVKIPAFKEVEPAIVQRLQEARVQAAIAQLYQQATIK
ncbi:SurA N-terminal domain-containing protein [Snodgrassella sp. CFCC 13594]|uniref:peptidylprolyl isomerase n=1 Tax=Snodgrassella sp. CFCC 13594 TaxID=1775559 RepID=UPI000A6DA410|nr:SurA N-terminal domain-containing protein [Snodgrassella sp. CFCC 13594]